MHNRDSRLENAPGVDLPVRRSLFSTLKIPGIYLLVGALWVFGSDRVLSVLVADWETLVSVQTLKGWLFIVVTTIMLYWLIEQDKRSIQQSNRALKHSLNDSITVEQALRESQERFNLAVSATNDGIWDLDLRTNQTYYSPVWMQILGYGENELPPLPTSWTDNIHPDDLNVALQRVQAHLSGQTERWRNVHRLRHKNGHWIWVDSRGKCFRDEAGQACRFVGTMTDITEQKRAEEAMHVQSELLQIILDHIPVMVNIYDRSGRLQWVNREWERVFGWSIDEARHQDVLAALYPDAEQHQAVLRFIQSADRQWQDFKTHLRDGRLLDTAWANVKLSDGRVLGIGQDISDRKRTEQALRSQAEREQLMRMTAQRIHQSLDLQETLNAVVTSVRHLLQVDRVIAYQFDADMNGKVVAEALAEGWITAEGCTIEDICFKSEAGEAYRRGRKRAIDNIYESELSECHLKLLESFQVKAHLMVPILLTQTGEAEPSQLWGLLIAHQCTAPRQWEPAQLELLDQLSVQLAIGIQQSELYFRVRQLNTTLEQQIEERTAELQQALKFEAVIRRITDNVRDSLDESQILQVVVQELANGLALTNCDIALFDFEQEQATVVYECMMGEVQLRSETEPLESFSDILFQLEQGQSLQFCEIIPKTRDSRWHPEAVLSCPIIDNQRLLGDIWLFRDAAAVYSEIEIRLVQQVTNQCAIAMRQARLFQAAQAQVDELQRLNTLKDDFLNTVSHELRTPISNMKMAIHMLKLAPESDRRQQYLTILETQCAREASLINDLLDLQRLDAQRYILQPEAITLQTWLPELAAPFFSRAQGRQQQLHINLAPDLGTIITDRTSLGRILSELLNNACKYTPSGGQVRLSVECSATSTPQTEPSKQTTVFTLSNQAAIPAAELPRIFDKFYRIPHGDPWKQGGTGLGLALVQKLVEQIEGQLRVESTGGFTVFTLELTDLDLDTALDEE
ncbi:PAS domain S-box protein [Oculatella sp. LEGE 06141]|uniref:PAS domain-containing sensor histidine kinase n=1 Tax=Oculatella sp. LEGE 06141 TaxID=1828648 RepID=UPI0018819794|nr:PAS domain S-box protein [Oculatella sp. LEGE 06141]MBE9182554.1 PAS domain S-box protein [Oculatella sp. LEGE 06141]